MSVLVVAPHADDETLGVGATIARHVDAGDEVTVVVMTGHGDEEHFLGPPELWKTVRAEARCAMEVLGVTELKFLEIPAVKVGDQPSWRVNQLAAEVLEDVRPQTLYVPFPYDLHRDHREIFHAFSVAWRPTTDAGRSISKILAYEVPSETHWNSPYLEPGFLPTTWIEAGACLDRKLKALSCYASQIPEWPHARSLAAVEHLARWRGSQMSMEAAEAFVLIRSLS